MFGFDHADTIDSAQAPFLYQEGWSFFVLFLCNPLGAIDFEVWQFLQERYRQDWEKRGVAVVLERIFMICGRDGHEVSFVES